MYRILREDLPEALHGAFTKTSSSVKPNSLAGRFERLSMTFGLRQVSCTGGLHLLGNSQPFWSLNSQPGCPCCPGQTPVANVVKAAGVVAGNTATRRFGSLCLRRKLFGCKCCSMTWLPMPSQRTNTMCRRFSPPISSARARAASSRTTCSGTRPQQKERACAKSVKLERPAGPSGWSKRPSRKSFFNLCASSLATPSLSRPKRLPARKLAPRAAAATAADVSNGPHADPSFGPKGCWAEGPAQFTVETAGRTAGQRNWWSLVPC
mmetsp:Transcript_102774/g.257794  ORF Transcript_102774/g.257794 Transcript_102774/m.257794 type:complete len:265 (-) Transcript_102774:65-859(-)